MRSALFSSPSHPPSPHSSSSSSSSSLFSHLRGRAAVLSAFSSPAPVTLLKSHSVMEKVPSGPLPRNDAECISLLDELQTIWSDVGESDVEKDLMLRELERECLEIYRRKVDEANKHRSQLRQAIADSEAEIATICFAMGETPVHLRQNVRSLKEELKVIIPQLEEMRERKHERLTQFVQVLEQIRCISSEISTEHGPSKIVVDEFDLSIRKLEDLQRQLDMLQKEKNERTRKVLNQLNALKSLCLVLGVDFKQTASEVHPSLNEADEYKNVSNGTIERLTLAIQRLLEVKLQRMHKLQDLATAILEMWHLMDTPVEEQQQFQNVTCNIAASEHEITEPNSLSIEFINYVEAEVLRLEALKVSKMKDLVLKKKIELDELRRRTHLIETHNCAESLAIENESLEPPLILEQLESQISIVKEEAFSRKEILERVEKWLAACEEESWLEEYNRDENRYNAGKGTHLMLKRAEKARAVVSKIPGIVETLTTKIMAWENERGTEFIYDGSSLLSMLEEYTILRQEKEQERKRQRDQRRLQGQVIAEQEVMFGTKPSPSKSQSTQKSIRGPNKRHSVGGAAVQPQKFDSLTSAMYPFSAKKANALPRGMDGSEVVGLPAKELKYSGNDACEGEATRRPFTPLGQPHSVPPTTPHKISYNEEENKAPIGVQLQITMSPAPACLDHETAVKMESQEKEISFEERRLALLLKG